MARFRAAIQGIGRASRLGDDRTGIRAELSTETCGVTVVGKAGLDDANVFEVYLTRGRWQDRAVPIYLGRITLYDGRPAWEPALPMEGQ